MKVELVEHPRWKEVEYLCNRIENLKRISKNIRGQIEKDCEG